MSVTLSMIEAIVTWCHNSFDLARERQAAWDEFFGTSDPRPIEYWMGAEDHGSRVRRFLGYFVFDWRLASGEKPGVVAARHLYSGRDQADMIRAVNEARYLIGVVRSVDRRTVYLELGDDLFEVRNTSWAGVVSINQAVVTHLVPARQGYWLAGPGWMVWPFSFGPGIRSSLKDWRFEPVRIERFIQGRVSDQEDRPPRRPPQDDTLEAAVERMTSWARAHNKPGLVMSVEQWQEMVQECQGSAEMTSFPSRVLDLSGEFSSDEEVQEVLDLTTNIWNNTPQPDRGGLSPRQIFERFTGKR